MASKFRKPLSAATKATLRRKAKASKRYTYATLAKVYRRGQGAFLSSGSRPRIGMAQWSMARVNKLIARGRSGTFDRDIILRASKRKRRKK